MAKEIDRQTLDLLNQLQGEINRFHGLRQLWAEAVANHRPLLASTGDLMKDQVNQVHSIVYTALRLCEHVFPGQSPHSRFKYVEVQETDEDDEE